MMKIKQLGDTKLKIITACKVPKTWNELVRLTGKTEPTMMVHLQELVGDGYLLHNQSFYHITEKGDNLLQRKIQEMSKIDSLAITMLRQILSDLEAIKDHNKYHCKQCRNRGHG